MIIKNVYSIFQILIFCVLLGIAVSWLLEFFFKKSNCYDLNQAASILKSQKQEPLWRGIIIEDNREKMTAIFGNSKSGDWTKVSIDDNGNVCFVEIGTKFQTVTKNIISL